MSTDHWIIIIGVVIAYFVYRSKKKKDSDITSGQDGANIEDIEEWVRGAKDRIFEIEFFESPFFIDCADAYSVMEVNYFRLKQRLSHDPVKALEIAKDWSKYVEALTDVKDAIIMLKVDDDEDSFERAVERETEPEIIKDEIEKKFKALLGEDWQKVPLDYHEKVSTMKGPDKKTAAATKLRDEWKFYYNNDSHNYHNLSEKWEKQHRILKEKWEKRKRQENNKNK